jgi:hypothetical protein
MPCHVHRLTQWVTWETGNSQVDRRHLIQSLIYQGKKNKRKSAHLALHLLYLCMEERHDNQDLES